MLQWQCKKEQLEKTWGEHPDALPPPEWAKPRSCHSNISQPLLQGSSQCTAPAIHTARATDLDAPMGTFRLSQVPFKPGLSHLWSSLGLLDRCGHLNRPPQSSQIAAKKIFKTKHAVRWDLNALKNNKTVCSDYLFLAETTLVLTTRAWSSRARKEYL